MLVYAKSPRGVLYINNQPIYGCETGRKPVNLPFEIYNQCRDGLQDASYREGILSKMFGKPFPIIAFTYTELRWLPENTLDNIGPLMMPDYDKTWSHKKKIDQIKIAIRDNTVCL